jgi:hypothetical protein
MGAGGAIASNNVVTVQRSIFLDNEATSFDSAFYIEYSTGKSLVENNIWVNNGKTDNYLAATILVRNTGDAEVAIRHNTIVQNGENLVRGISVWSGKVMAQNNIIADHAYGVERKGGEVVTDHNLYFNNQEDESNSITSSNHITGQEPLFVKPEANDYRLQPDSPAVDKGTPSDTLVDFRNLWRTEKALPDIGAFEINQGYVPPDEIMTLSSCPNGVGNVGELKEIIQLANIRPGVNRVALPANCVYTLTEVEATWNGETSGLSIITDPLELVGNNATIRHSSEITEPFGLLTVIQSSLWVSDLALEDGYADYGPAIVTTCSFRPGEVMELTRVTLRNHRSRYAGGAIFAHCVDLKITDSLFENNKVGEDNAAAGGALYAYLGSLEVNNTIFRGNQATGYAGAILAYQNPTQIHRSTFANNNGLIGGAIYLIESKQPGVWTNNLWQDNKAESSEVTLATRAAAIYMTKNHSLTLLHNTFVNTLPTDAAAVVADGQEAGVETRIHNSIFVNFGGSIATRNPVTNPIKAEGNLFFNSAVVGEGLLGDPLFVDAASGDYHLQAISPAVNNGIDRGVMVDKELTPRPYDNGFDIGAYEYVAPDEPENPDQPDNPEEPGNPDDPEQPDDPEDPDEPDNPDQPGNPDDPNQPGTPDDPQEPEEQADRDHHILLPILKR